MKRPLCTFTILLLNLLTWLSVGGTHYPTTKNAVSVGYIPEDNIELNNPDRIEPQLIHFWFFGGDIPNNTPLEYLGTTFSLVDGALITYHSALEGYPFHPDHHSWRQASMERRNAPTGINYRPQGNSWIPYEQSGMRGIQVRQPYRGDAGENTVFLHIPTTGFEDIVVGFAAMDQGDNEDLMAAEELLIDYAIEDGEDWFTTGLDESVLKLMHEEYLLYEIDFSGIEAVNNNPDFVLRIRFDGQNLYLNEGDRVSFNNISVDGIPLEPPDLYTVTFEVKDVAGDEIADAIITLGPYTNEMGDYVFQDVTAGNYIYVVAALGYDDRVGTITVEDDVTITVVMKEEEDEIPDDLTLIHYWFFGGDLPNDTPLESIEPAYSLAGDARITYHSALEGYPFDVDHPNWRKASMERRNRPTVINYRHLGNDGIPFDESGMRGIQVRQPFTGDAGENTVYLHLPTIGYQDPRLSFAAKDNGNSEDLMAAEDLVIDYAIDGSGQWLVAGLEATTIPLLFEEYQLYVINFSGTDEVNDNPDFKVRIRFDGPNMDLDNGDRVVFNNIALDAYPKEETDVENYRLLPTMLVSPNPAEEFFHIDVDEPGTMIRIFNTSGSLIYQERMADKRLTIDAGLFGSGVYIIQGIPPSGNEPATRRLVVP